MNSDEQPLVTNDDQDDTPTDERSCKRIILTSIICFILTILIQIQCIIYNYRMGPLELLVQTVVPSLGRWGLGMKGSADEGETIKICPLDPYLDYQNQITTGVYSKTHDPRNKKIIPSLFSHFYIHSDHSRNNILFKRNWSVFPQVKQGALCITEQMRVVATVALHMMGVEFGEAEGEDGERRRKEMVEKFAMLSLRDVWRYLVLWEYGGIVIDEDVLNSILANDNTSDADSSIVGNNRLEKLLSEWSNADNDAILYWIHNAKDNPSKDKSRIPFTGIMGARQAHPFVYYAGKSALKMGIWDSYNAIDDHGRITDVSPVQEGLKAVTPIWDNQPTGSVVNIEKEQRTISFLNGDTHLSHSMLTHPAWQSIISIVKSTQHNKPYLSNEDIIKGFRSTEINRQLFSCMEYGLKLTHTQ
ncbi:predicted protein [Thalassiosira pseudonana CCMP1335]|uniref:Uncharacterized protein n=1 Tax=Thalassiosira pseudonana TaxID=35128 RepID=B8BSH3_THAPS|nr:predicted protein [Thalassiosira pseudonana CCMP1335]EED96128.1 predicted protein [Thalassiosira pseudonana CCMP1335]